MTQRVNPYKVPEGYFDSLKESIMARTVKAPAVDKPSWRMVFGGMGAFAASFVLLVGLAWGGFYLASNHDQQQTDTVTADLSIALYEVDEEMIVDMAEPTVDDNTLLAQAAIEYVDFYGGADTVE